MQIYIVGLFLSLFFLLESFASEKTVISVGYDSLAIEKVAKKDLVIASEVWLKSVMKDTSFESKFIVYDTPQELSVAFKNKEVNYITSYGQNIIKYFDIKTLLPSISSAYNDPQEEFYVVVANKKYKDNWKTKTKLNIGIGRQDGIQKVYLDYVLLKNNSKKTLNYLPYVKSSRILYKLFFNKLDIGMIPYRTYKVAKELNPQISKHIVLVEKTNITSIPFNFFSKDLPKEVRESTIKTAIELNKDIRGQQLFNLYKIDLLRKTNMENLKNIKELMENYDRFKKKKGI